MKQEDENDYFNESFSQKETAKNEANHHNKASIDFQQVFRIYQYKLNKTRSNFYLQNEIEKFWHLLDHTSEGEIEKKSYLTLFHKIYKLFLPFFNHEEISLFLENEWLLHSKRKSTMCYERFAKCLFKFIHIWAAHINKEEYLDTLKMIFQRITKYIKTHEDGRETHHSPQIRVKFYKVMTPKEYEEKTWESCDPTENLDENLMQYPEDKQEGDEIDARRPFMVDAYSVNSPFVIYNEEVFYEDENFKKLNLCESVRATLLPDEEIVIYGLPAQYILTYYKNNMNILKELCIKGNFERDLVFRVSDFKLYDKHIFYYNFSDESIAREIIDALENNFSLTLTRDLFTFPDSPEIPADFVDEELYIFNNLRRNPQFDRYLNFQEVKLSQGKFFVNIDSLISNATHRKALENIIHSDKVGIKSSLWSEKIHDKIERIIKSKFALINNKLLYFVLNIANYSSVIEFIAHEIDQEKAKRFAEAENDMAYFKKFESKNGVIYDKWDSDFDLIEEANKKAPVVLVIGVPLCGKTSVCKKIADDLNMVYLHPQKFFDKVFEKVAKYDEDMLEWDDGEDQIDPDNPDEVLPKKEKPGVQTRLTKLEFDIYSDLISGREISRENFVNLYKHIIHSDLAQSRGLIIDQNSSIAETSFAEMLLDGHFGNVKVDYVVELKIPQDELDLRVKTAKLNLKTLELILKRDIELMWNPKKKKKDIYEDEIDYDEEGEEIKVEEEPIELTDEEKDLIPKDADLIDITDFETDYANQLEYYHSILYPKFRELIKTLKKNYYIEVNIIGLDADEAADLVKCRLDFASLPRNIPTSLDPADFRDLLIINREGILPYRRWSLWKQIDPVALKDDFLLLTGSTDYAAECCQRVFVFVSEENKNKFIENPKKYLLKPPQVPYNYRVCIFGPSKSGKNTIAQILTDMFGWKKINLNEIYEAVKEYQKNWDEAEPNTVYGSKIHFSANEFKELIAPSKKGEKKPENFYSKIIFMLDYLGIKLDKKKTREEFFEERKYHADKLKHLFNKRQKEKEKEELERQRLAEEEERKLNAEKNARQNETETDINDGNKENVDNPNGEEAGNSNNNPGDPGDAENAVENNENNNDDNNPVEEEEEEDPFPPEEDYDIEDLRSDQFYYAFDDEGNYPRPGGFVLINCPSTQEEIDKFQEFKIDFDKVIYLVDQSEEPLKELAIRKNPNYLNLEEEKQNIEMDKIKAEVAKIEETLPLLREQNNKFLREKYNREGEDNVVEINCVDSLENIKLKLMQVLNPFYIRPDPEDKIYSNSDVNPDEKAPIPKGEFGIFCPVTYKDERWLYYAGEEFETQVNQRRYRFASEKEMELFKKDPSVYINIHNNVEEDGFTSMTPVSVLPPHIFITGYQGGGVSFFTSLLSREFKLKKRDLKKEFMDVWDYQSANRKSMRVAKKKEELIAKNEEIKQNNMANPDQEPQELINIEEELANDATLEDEEENFNAVDNDKAIFKKLFFPETASVYDSTWYDMNEKIQATLLEFLLDTRRVPNVMVIIKVSLKTILERHLHLDQIKEQHQKLEEISLEKKKEAIEKLIYEKKEAILDQMKQDLLDADDGNGSNMDLSLANGTGNPNMSLNKTLPELKDIPIELTQEEQDEIMLAPDPDLPELETMIANEKEKLVTRYENNANFLSTLTEQLKEKLIPVIEISNDLSTENVYKNLLFNLQPYITNRVNLIEKQLVYPQFPEVTMRKTRDLIHAQVYKLSSYGKYSPISPEKLLPTTQYPLLYRDRIYFFNTEEERNLFQESPLTYRTGKEFPLDCCPASSFINGTRNIVYVIGVPRSGKSTIAKMIEELGYYRLSLRRACADLLEKLNDCLLKSELLEILYSGASLDDNLAIRIISRRISLEDLANRNIVVDGFPFTLSQGRLLSEVDPCLVPSFVFICESQDKTILKRMQAQKGFKGITEVISERLTNSKDHMKDIIKCFNNLKYDLKYLNTEKSLWYLKDLVVEILEKRRKNEFHFAFSFNKNKPSLLSNILPKKILKDILFTQKESDKIQLYSPVALKIKNEFNNNKYLNDCMSNNIVLYNNFHLLSDEEEFALFQKSPQMFEKFLNDVKNDIHPPQILSLEKIASITHTEPGFYNEMMSADGSVENSLDAFKNLKRAVKFEYQNCCPITIAHDKLMKEGKLMHVVQYKMKYYLFDSADKMLKFCQNPDKYFKMKIPVKKVLDDNHKLTESQVNFENTVNYLETNFASLITKGMLELSKNRIKFPHISVKETSIKYLALFLKANNPNNNEYAKTKYAQKFEEFMKSAKLPFGLLNVYNNYHQETDQLKKDLIRKQLNNLAVKYDDIMDKAKTLKNTRFVDFFKKSD